MEGRKMVYVTSDQHFNHWNIIKYCDRPFATTADMNAAMIKRWNTVVGPDDIVYHLGDFCLYTPVDQASRILNALNGSCKILVRGNHDGTATRMKRVGFNMVCDRVTVSFRRKRLLLIHDVSDVTARDYDDHDVILFGHSHNGWFGDGKFVNVGVDSPIANFGPIAIKNIMERQWAKCLE